MKWAKEMKENSIPKQDLLKGFQSPSNKVDPTLFPFRILDKFLVTLEISNDELKRWFKRGWISFDTEKQKTFDEAEYLEVEFIKSLVQSGLSDEWIEKILLTLEKPYSYDIRWIAYSFSKKCWLQPPAEEEIEDFTEDDVNSYLYDLSESEEWEILEEFKETIDDLLSNKGN